MQTVNMENTKRRPGIVSTHIRKDQLTVLSGQGDSSIGHVFDNYSEVRKREHASTETIAGNRTVSHVHWDSNFMRVLTRSCKFPDMENELVPDILRKVLMVVNPLSRYPLSSTSV